MDPNYGIIGLLLLIAVIGAIIYSRYRAPTIETIISDDPSKPYLWLYYDTTQVNSRLWVDFGARSSRALNLPYLNLCYESILKNADAYNVRVIKGIEGVADILGGWDKLPAEMELPEGVTVPVLNKRQREMIRSAVLREKGGMWLDPSVVVMREIPVPDVNTVFGITNDIMIATPAALRANDWFAVYVVAGSTDAPLHDFRILQRTPNGKRIEIDDLLASSDVPPFVVPADTIFVPIPSEEIQRLRSAGWFLKSSEAQIMESGIMIAKIFHDALGY
jgi:hypothetical protein